MRASPACTDIASLNSWAELKDVQASGAAVVVDDDVSPIADIELVHIRAGSAFESVVTTATDKHIVSGAAVERIVTVAPEEPVGALIAIQLIVALVTK